LRRRAEEVEIAGKLPAPRSAVFAPHADVAIHVFARLLPACSIRLLQNRRIDVVLGRAAQRVGLACGRKVGAKSQHRFAGQHVNLPGLQVAAGRRKTRDIEQIAKRADVDRLSGKTAAGMPGQHGVTHSDSRRRRLNFRHGFPWST
jgi:hypothetical protein